MPDVTAGAQIHTQVDLEAVTAITGDIAPLPHPPAETSPGGSLHGPLAVESRQPDLGGEANFAADVEFATKPGEHPDDRTAPGYELPHDTPGGDAPRGKASFDTDNDEAVAVFQRASESFTTGLWIISGATQIVGRMAGRTGTTLSVPTTDEGNNAIQGVRYAPNQSQLSGPLNTCSFLLPGASITIPSEGPVWVAPLFGNATGYVIVMTTDNPSGGQLGGL